MLYLRNRISSIMESFNCHGLGVALITPFNQDKEVDYEALRKMVRHLIEGGVDYIVVQGTTAETPTLSRKEKEESREFIKRETNGSIPLVLGLGSNNTKALVEEIKETDLDGFSAILSVTPYYNKPTQEGLYLHFSEIAKASPLPVILYNVPGRTGVNLSAQTTLRLSREFTNIIAVKEASGNLKQIEEIIDNKPAQFKVLSGDDSLTYSLIKMGAEGVISVVGNAFPKEYGKMVRLCLDKNFDDARKLDTKFSGLYEELFRDGNPAGVKSLLHSMGLIANELRLPLVRTSTRTDEHLKEILSIFND